MSKRRFQISLAHWLLIVAVVGAASGLYLRSRFGPNSRWERTRFVWANQICEGFLVEGMWRRGAWGKGDQLLYLLAWPRGPRVRGVAATYGDVPKNDLGVSRLPAGLYVDGRRVPMKPGQLVWIYSAYEGNGNGTVEPLKVTQGNVAVLGVEDFNHLEQMPCWPEIEAALVKYSKFVRRQKDKTPPLITNPGETPP